MKFNLPKLPFAKNALEPYMSEDTIDYHYGKHHNAYVTKLNALIEGTEYENMSLEDIILNSTGGVYNNAAQTWNHTFFFFQLSAQAKLTPDGALAEVIDAGFGSLKAFKVKFAEAAATLFGSGWVWLVKGADDKLAIRQTANALNPMVEGDTPLLVCDVWEHAYYLDYQNKRPDFLDAFWNVLDWGAIEKRFAIA